MSLFSVMSADKSADASADALCIIIQAYSTLVVLVYISEWTLFLKFFPYGVVFTVLL